MKALTRRAAVVVTAGALGLGGLAVVPALAGDNPFAGTTVAAADPAPGWRGGGGPWMGPGMGGGPGGGMAARDRDGTCAVTAPKGTLTGEQRETLAAMAEEEKLAHDLYAAFADKYPLPIFDRIASAETQHLTIVRVLLDRYDVADPTAGKAAGTFSDPGVQAMYDRLLADGSASQAAALRVGQQVERTDIADLRAALEGLTAPDVRLAYTHLRTASQRHLTAFTRWSTR